jgi:hypothetical protein
VIAGKKSIVWPTGISRRSSVRVTDVNVLVSRWTCRRMSKLMAQMAAYMPHDPSREHIEVQNIVFHVEQDTEQWART